MQLDMELEDVLEEPDTRTINMRSPQLSKTRSLSDGGGTPKLSPSPFILESGRRQSKDDSNIRERIQLRETEKGDIVSVSLFPLPSTPVKSAFPPLRSNLPVHLPRDAQGAAHHPTLPKQPTPSSPKLENSQIYASPTGTNILPRRSRGLDFSRAATSLHHSTLAAQASPDSSPTIGSRALNIPSRRPGDFAPAEQSSNSLWSVMGSQERANIMHISSSVGSNPGTLMGCSSGSSSSDDDDLMDDDMDEAILSTPHGRNSTHTGAHPSGMPWTTSPAVNSLMSFQQRQRPRKQPKKRLQGSGQPVLGSAGLPNQPLTAKSPPNHASGSGNMSAFSQRRESISWAANQLHISGSESDDNVKAFGETADSPSRPGVIRRAVTRRGSLLPKTKGFARIRAALMEESTPVDADMNREAEVIRQVRESDMDLEPRIPLNHSTATTALSSPNLVSQEHLDDIAEDVMIMDSVGGGLGLTGGFRQQLAKNTKRQIFWDNLGDNSVGMPSRITPPPPPFARASSSMMSTDDLSMDSPAMSASGHNPFGAAATNTSSSGHDTPQMLSAREGSQSSGGGASMSGPSGVSGVPPSAAEITRRINSKRRRDDDFDPVSFKRRAVSPGMSVHNSPIMQSPMQRDPWGSRPGSGGGDTVGKTVSGGSAPSDSGSIGSGTPGRLNGKGRIGFQGMVDTNDGITRLTIDE